MTKLINHFHKRLWAAAEQLRANGSLKLNAISEPILGLIFLKFADYESYKKLLSAKDPVDLGVLVNQAMLGLETANKDLVGVLPKNYTNLARLKTDNNRLLHSILQNFDQIPPGLGGDTFGKIYEYFLGEFARAEGAKGGEFFTPGSITKLLVEIIEPYHGKILDPACGSGGMFVQSIDFVKRHQLVGTKKDSDVMIYGQEKSESNIRIAKMNLAIHGLVGRIELANSFYQDQFGSVGAFDFVLANPPFNIKGKDQSGQIIIDPQRIQGDPRYSLGLPTTEKGEISNGNYLWIQMCASALSPTGRSGFVMSNASSDAGKSEHTIRRSVVDSGIVDIMVSVGGNMFMNASLSCTLWFLDKGKAGTAREKKVLFINAQDIYTSIDRAHKYWTDDQIQEIAAIVRSYREEPGSPPYLDIPGRCQVATLDQIRDNDYSLNPGRYIVTPTKPFDHVIDFKVEFEQLTKQAHLLESRILQSA